MKDKLLSIESSNQDIQSYIDKFPGLFEREGFKHEGNFYAECLDRINKVTVLIAEDGIIPLVNGYPVADFISLDLPIEYYKDDILRSNIFDLARKYTGVGYYEDVKAPSGFKVSEFFDENNLSELVDIIKFDERAIPQYLNKIKQIEHADVLIVENSQIIPNNNRSSFDNFRKTWDLDEVIYQNSYSDNEGYEWEIYFTARDLLENNLNFEFHNLSPALNFKNEQKNEDQIDNHLSFR